jgi:hypothetical protein
MTKRQTVLLTPLLHLLIKVPALEQLQQLNYGALTGNIVCVINIIQCSILHSGPRGVCILCVLGLSSLSLCLFSFISSSFNDAVRETHLL